jgi:riboflavin kinase/FMN adenylyltransferase
VSATRPIALTIGVFDGLHRGHQTVIEATVREARERSGTSWVATFDPHPDTVVRGSDPRPWITPPEERAGLLHAMGVDRVEIVRFDREVQALPPERFLDRVLGPAAPLRALVIGPDFRMGHGRVGDAAYLEALGGRRGFVVRVTPFLSWDGAKLSSTRLRQEIQAGRLEVAAEIMGRPYMLEGRVGSGAGRGAGLGYPTANLEMKPDKLLPGPGVYLSRNEVDGTDWPGMTYVGSAGTFGPGPIRVEVHLLDFQGSLRGHVLKSMLIAQVRADEVFATPDELVRAMDRDLEKARSYWASEKPASHGTTRPPGPY